MGEGTAITEYDDNTLMPFGAHKDKKLVDVPDSYLWYLWNNKPISDAKLEAYIKDNLQSIQKGAKFPR